MKPYLLAYNLASALGWAYVVFLCLYGLRAGDSAATLWTKVGMPLTVVQTAAVLEIFHSLLGLVRSPLFTALIQVGSRLAVLWGFCRPYSHDHWSLYPLVLSWALVEVPRYLFYCCALVMPSSKIPFPLFWLRYSLFMILYPTGISGEIMQLWQSLGVTVEASPVWYRFTIMLLVLYAPGGPFMINNMWQNRKRSFRNRAKAANPRPVSGLVWPITNAAKQERSTSKTNKAIFAAAVGAIDEDAKEAVVKERNWRYGFQKHVERGVRLSLRSSSDCITMAKAGLEAAHKEFQFVRGGKTVSIKDAMKQFKHSYKTGKIRGSADKPKRFELSVPYGNTDPSKPYYAFKKNIKELTGSKLKATVADWLKRGVIEPSAAEAINSCVDHPEWLDLSHRYFVLLGATSAMGPLDILLKHGANVIAIDLDRDFIWSKLIKKVRQSCGTLIFPYKGDKDFTDLSDDELAKVAGSNLLEDTPEICDWLKTVCPGKQLTIGNYTYLDGALHVQLSVACDCIISGLCEERKDTAIAFLCTPTDCHVIPEDANKAAAANFKSSPAWINALASITPRTMLVKNALKPQENKTNTFHLVDGVSVAQGPNYILAKRIQHWRAVVARTSGHVVSSNIAPSTATASVVHAPMFAAAYGSFHRFKPLEVMYQETSNAVMGALLIFDVTSTNSAAHPSFKLNNPYELMKYGSFHGGVWRCGYKIGSIGEVAVLSYFASKYSVPAAAVVALTGGGIKWVITGKFLPF